MKSGFVKIDRAILGSEIGNDPVAIAIYVYLACSSNWSQFNGLEKGEVIVSQTELAERFGISRMTVYRRITKLEQAGIISRERIGNVQRFRIEKYIDFSTGKKTGNGAKKLFDF